MPLIGIIISIIIVLYLTASGWKIDSDKIEIGIGPFTINFEKPDSVPTTHIPVITKVKEREEYINNDLKIHKDIYFNDALGDARLVTYDLAYKSDNFPTKLEDDLIYSFKEEQKEGASVTGTWNCGHRSRIYTVILRAHIIDEARFKSDPVNISFNCH